MADDHPNGFLKFTRNPIAYRDPTARTGDYDEIYAQDWEEAQLRQPLYGLRRPDLHGRLPDREYYT